VPDETAVTGLIGEGVSYLGTGATPRPGQLAARHGPSKADAADASSAGIIGVL
jgi:hypothetical protein